MTELSHPVEVLRVVAVEAFNCFVVIQREHALSLFRRKVGIDVANGVHSGTKLRQRVPTKSPSKPPRKVDDTQLFQNP
jgi:hypothetical protein